MQKDVFVPAPPQSQLHEELVQNLAAIIANNNLDRSVRINAARTLLNHAKQGNAEDVEYLLSDLKAPLEDLFEARLSVLLSS